MPPTALFHPRVLLPVLRGTSYDGVTIKQVLQMSSGVGWNEDYTDLNSDVARMYATPPDPGLDAEARGQAEAVASSIDTAIAVPRCVVSRAPCLRTISFTRSGRSSTTQPRGLGDAPSMARAWRKRGYELGFGVGARDLGGGYLQRAFSAAPSADAGARFRGGVCGCDLPGRPAVSPS